MHRAVSLVFSVSLVFVSAAALAQVPSGSTGGTIGKQNKSISGEDRPAQPAQSSKRSARTRDEHKKISTDNGGAGGQKVYANPTLNGMRVDWCSSDGLGGCGKPAADAWCRSKGFAHSASFAMEYHSPVIRMGSRTKCDGFCGAFTEVVCE